MVASGARAIQTPSLQSGADGVPSALLAGLLGLAARLAERRVIEVRVSATAGRRCGSRGGAGGDPRRSGRPPAPRNLAPTEGLHEAVFREDQLDQPAVEAPRMGIEPAPARTYDPLFLARVFLPEPALRPRVMQESPELALLDLGLFPPIKFISHQVIFVITFFPVRLSQGAIILVPLLVQMFP